MTKKSFPMFGMIVGLLVLAACGGGGTSGVVNPPPGQPSTAPVSVTIRDTPPAGITVLSFEVTVTQARLQPGNVALVTTPIEIEVKQLEVEAAFLNTISVPAGTYTSIDVTFSNPELTFKNDTGSALPAPLNCANGAVCEFKPTVTATISYNGAPFPLNVVANTPLGLLVDVNLSNIITSAVGVDFSAAGAVVVSQLQVAAGTGELEEVEDLVGSVTAKDTANNQFTLQTTQTGQSLTIKVDSNTQFEDFNDVGCATANFACVAVGQVVEVDLRLMPGGVLLAKKVEVEDNDNEEELEGIITKINSATQFEMVLIEEATNVAGVDVGQVIQVNLLPNTQFKIDDDNLNVNSADFDAAADLLVGQAVEIERKSNPTGTPPAIDTDRVKLKGTRLTARVQSVDTANSQFTINSLPGIFTNQVPAITSLVVKTQAQTKFERVANLAALAAGNTVSVRALLFNGPSGPFMVAKKVRKR